MYGLIALNFIIPFVMGNMFFLLNYIDSVFL